MKKYLALLMLLMSCLLAQSQVPVYVSSSPDGDGVGTPIGNNDIVTIAFDIPVKPNINNQTDYFFSIGTSLVYSAKGKFWDDLGLTMQSKIAKINPLDNTQLILDLNYANVTITYNAPSTFYFSAGFLQSVSTSEDINEFELYYLGVFPTLFYQDPVHGKDNVLTNDTIRFNYTARISFNTLVPKYITIKNSTTGNTLWSVQSNASASSKVIISYNKVFLKNVPLHVDSTYKVIIDAGFFKTKPSGGSDVAGVADGAWSFSTKEITAVAPFTPADGSLIASITADYSITFSENITKNTGYVYIKDGVGLVEQIPISSCSVSGAILTIPHSALNEATPYYIQMSKGCVQSSTTNALFKGIYDATTWDFTTESANVWVGGVSNDFADGANWSSGIYNPLTPVVIDAGSNPAKITTSVSAPDVTIKPLGKLEIAVGGTLTMSGKLKLESSSTSNSSLVVNGTLSVAPSNVFIYQYAANSSPSVNAKKGYASPVAGATGTSIGTTQTILKFDNATAKYVAVAPATTWDAAVGYASYASSSLVFSGAVNTASTYSMPLIYTGNPGGGAIYSSPYNFYGNPYTAPLDWKQMWTALTPADTACVRQTCWILKESGTWITINGKTGAVSGGTGTTIPRGHAFMLRAKPPVSRGDTMTTIVFKKAHLIGGNQTYLKSLKAEALPTYIRITGISDNNYSSEVLYGFHANAAFGSEVYDSECISFPNTTGTFIDRVQLATYTTSGTPIALTINTVPNFVDSTKFNIAYYAETAGPYAIELTQLDDVYKTPKTLVTLTDTVAKKTITMVEGDKYYFYTNATPAPVKNRFRIKIDTTFTPTSLPTVNQSINTSSAYFSNKAISLDVKSQELLTVEVCDLNGAVVLQTQLQGANKYAIPFEKTGFYVVRVTGKESSQSLKIIAR